jgi:hypothetical protein
VRHDASYEFEPLLRALQGGVRSGRRAEMEDQEPRDSDESDELEASIMQADRAFASESFGTTAEEELAGESLDQRLAEERPERSATDEVLAVIDEGLSDEEDELIGEAVVEEDAFASPEEAAVRERDTLPGATDHDDPHPTDADR